MFKQKEYVQDRRVQNTTDMKRSVQVQVLGLPVGLLAGVGLASSSAIDLECTLSAHSTARTRVAR